MQIIKTVADFKRLLQVGIKVNCIWHLEPAGRDTEGKPIFKNLDRGPRECTIKQTNSFALKTWKEKESKFVDSWCQYPKASEVEINENKITIFETDRDGKRRAVLTYWID